MARDIIGEFWKDANASERAGYDVYETFGHAWVSDLGDRIEITDEHGESMNIWIDATRDLKEYQLADTLKVIDDAIYQIDDNVLPSIQALTVIDEARKQLYGAYAKIRDILDNKFPESKLYAEYNLHEA